MKRIPTITLRHANNIDVLEQMQSSTIDLTVTSPPYKTADGYSRGLMQNVFKNLYRLHRPNTLFFMNFGQLAEDPFRPFEAVAEAIGAGFKLKHTITWEKNHFTPIQGDKTLNNTTEFIFMLYKGNAPKLNRLAIGVPYADPSNAKRFNNGVNLRCRGTCWKIPYETITNRIQKLHKDRFPVQLPEDCIKLAGYKVRLVLDPFMGSATTAVACINQHKDFIGMERDPRNYTIAYTRICDLKGNLFHLTNR